jgi:hypothetical protein
MRYLILLVFLYGCYTAKDAQKDLNKVQEKHPQELAKVCKDKYPCLPKKTDTVEKVYYDLIEVECPEVYIERDTFISKDTIYVKVLKTLPRKEIIVTKYIKDSAELQVALNQLAVCKQETEKLKADNDRKKSIISNGLIVSLSLLLALLVYILMKKR